MNLEKLLNTLVHLEIDFSHTFYEMSGENMMYYYVKLFLSVDQFVGQNAVMSQSGLMFSQLYQLNVVVAFPYDFKIHVLYIRKMLLKISNVQEFQQSVLHVWMQMSVRRERIYTRLFKLRPFQHHFINIFKMKI